MRRLVLLALSTLAAVAVGVLALVPAAQAAVPPNPSAPGSLAVSSDAKAAAQNGHFATAAASGGYYYVAISGAETRFYPYGEVLSTYDTKADGHHAVTYYATSNGAQGSLADYHGNGTHTTRNLSIPESGSIGVVVCVAEGSKNLSCSDEYILPAAN